MAKLQRVKRRVIRQAVQENLDTMYGTRRRRRAGHHAIQVTARSLIYLATPLALVGLVFAVSSLTLQKRAGEWLPSDSTASASFVAPGFVEREIVPPPRTTELEFSRPEPIDPSVLPLALRTVVLDPGHGGDNLGTMSPNGLVEKEVTLDIALRLQQLLEDSSYEVVLTRQQDRGMSLRERAELANQARGDVLISIHVNWIENREVRGVETFYLGPTDDPYLEALAAQENQDSGYSLADLRDILQQVYAGVRQEESRRLAEAVQADLFEALFQVNNGVRNRGVKSAPFGVLTSTAMPAILAEVSCVSNQVESRLLMTPIYRQYIAEALFRGIESYSYNLSRAYELDG